VKDDTNGNEIVCETTDTDSELNAPKFGWIVLNSSLSMEDRGGLAV
jgi:hypothetical protein